MNPDLHELQLANLLLDGELSADEAEALRAGAGARTTGFLAFGEELRAALRGNQAPPAPPLAGALADIRERVRREETLEALSASLDHEGPAPDLGQDDEARAFAEFVEGTRPRFAGTAEPPAGDLEGALAAVATERLLAQVSQLIDGELPPGEAERVREQARAHPEAARFLEFAGQGRRRHAPPPEPGGTDAALEEIRAAIRDEQRRRAPRGGLLRFPGAGILAAAAALLFAAGLAWVALRPSPTPPAAFAAMIVEEVETDLPDALISMYTEPETGCQVIWIEQMEDPET